MYAETERREANASKPRKTAEQSQKREQNRNRAPRTTRNKTTRFIVFDGGGVVCNDFKLSDLGFRGAKANANAHANAKC